MSNTATLTINVTSGGPYTVTVPTPSGSGATISEFIRTAATCSGGFWVNATTFIPMLQITSIVIATS